MSEQFSYESTGHVCPWPPVGERDPETGLFPRERPRVFSPHRMSFPPGPGRPRGSHSHEDRVGEVYGHLTLIEVQRKDGRVHYRCECSCGIETLVRWDNLKSGRTISCGHVGYGDPYSKIGDLRVAARAALAARYEAWKATRDARINP